MVSRLFLVYVLVELAVLVALASTIGLGWTLLLLLAAFVAGLALAGSQLKRQLARLRNGLTPQQSQLATDGVMVALAASSSGWLVRNCSNEPNWNCPPGLARCIKFC